MIYGYQLKLTFFLAKGLYMSFSIIKQSLERIDYAWFKPQIYLVLVPGLSLIIQKVQLANTLPLLITEATTQSNVAQVYAKSRQFANICKWHLAGSLVQIAVSIIAIVAFATPLFLLLGILATCELAYTLINSIRNRVILYEFHPNGKIKRVFTENIYMSSWVHFSKVP